jgi:SulP family sulfate permease
VHFHPQNVVPFVSWLRGYRWRFLKPDLIAGLTVAVVAVPQSMAYALIAGLPVEYGLYASIVPTIVGCLWGSSAHLITGPTTTASLVVFSTLSVLAAPGGPDYIQLALLLSLMVGLVKIAMGVARLGALLNFVSHAVLTGFTTGAAVLIAAKQLPDLLGLRMVKGVFLPEQIYQMLRLAHQIQLLPVLLGVGTILIILALKRWRPAWPGTLLAMALAGGLVALLRLDQRGVAVVGAIPAGLPPLSWPTLETMGQFAPLAPGALAIAILGLVEAMSIARAIADVTRQRLNVNQEFIGQGLANISAALFSGYAGSGSFTRSAVNFRSGAKTPLSGIISSAAVAATLLLAAPLATQLPRAALAGVLIVVAWEMVYPNAIARTVRSTRSDAAVLVVTFVCTLLLRIEFAIYVGVLLSIGLHLAATSHPRIYSVVPDLSTGKMVDANFGDICCQMQIVHVEGSIFFGSTAFVNDDLQRRLRNHPGTAHMLLRMHKVNTLDASGIHILEILLAELRRRQGGLYFSAVNHRVFEVLKNSGFLKDVGESHVHTATGAAIRQAMRESFCAHVCAACPVNVFQECPELKQGNWEIFGAGLKPRDCPGEPVPAKAPDDARSG